MEQKNKDQKKKRRILGICIPLLLLGIGGGATVGGLFAAGVFAPDTLTKVELSSVVGKLTPNWKDNISSLPVDGVDKNTGLTGAGYTIDQNQKVNDLENVDGVAKILREDPKWNTLSEDERNLVNQISVSTAQSGTDPFKYVTVSAAPDSRNFTGSFRLVFWSSDKKVNLSDDITVTNLNASEYEEYKTSLSLTGVQLADVIKRANTSGDVTPDTNQMKLTYLNGSTYSDWAWDSTPESTPWGDGNTTKKIGIGEANTDQVTSLKLWESTSDNDGWYAHLRLVPITNSAVYNPYNESDPSTYKDITLKIAKTDITSVWNTAKWTVDYNNQFIVQPTGGSVETKFQELFKAETWFQTLNTYETTWGFTGSGSNWVFTVKNNPFYTTQVNTDSSSVPAAYKFETTVREKQNLSTLITITDLNNYFYYSLVGEKYAREDVLYALKNKMGESAFNNIRWSDVVIDTSTDGEIYLSGDPESVIYSSIDVKKITYTIIS